MDEFLLSQLEELSGSGEYFSFPGGEKPPPEPFIMDIVIEYSGASTPLGPSDGLDDLLIVYPNVGSKCLGLERMAPGRWESSDCVELPSGFECLDCVLKSKEENIGSWRVELPVSTEDYFPGTKEGSPDPGMHHFLVADVRAMLSRTPREAEKLGGPESREWQLVVDTRWSGESRRFDEVDLSSGNPYETPHCLGDLAGSSAARCECTEVSCDSHQDITVFDGTPDSGLHYGLHGEILYLYRSLRFGQDFDMKDKMVTLEICKKGAVSPAPHPDSRLAIARMWGILASMLHPSSPDTLEAYDTAANLVSLCNNLGHASRGGFRMMLIATDLPPAAVAAGCEADRTDKAIEWLEKGRCLVWGRLGHLRAPFDRLREEHPMLADSLANVARRLQLREPGREETRLARRTFSFPISHRTVEEPLGEELEYGDKDRTDLMNQWDDLLGKVRLLPSFETFLKPLECAQIMQNLPEEGVIVVINCSGAPERCDALALLAGLEEPYHIPLPKFPWEMAHQYWKELSETLRARGLRRRGEGDMDAEEELDRSLVVFRRNRARDKGPVLRRILRRLWLEIVKPVLDGLAIHKSDRGSGKTLPRIWWCPTGPLSFLPIHAAGIYDGPECDCISDYVVSSYTPTVAMLTKRANEDLPVEKAGSGIFLTCQPMVPGWSRIPGTETEVRSIFEKAAECNIPARKCEGDEVTPEECLEYMKSSRAVHLACHGVQLTEDPRKSTFKFHSGNLDLSKIMEADLEHADFAFLSACQTSVGFSDFLGEDFHLAGALLAAGYRRVVATTWSINDRVAARVANDFYESLWSKRDNHACSGGDFDGRMSAYALHDAIQKLRGELTDSEDDLFTWVPYVHYGY